MSEHLQKRDPEQCRSHHQKMSIKYGNIEQIIEKIASLKISGNETCKSGGNSIELQKVTASIKTDLNL